MNLIANGSFEDGFREVDGVPELKVANGWEPWWLGETRPEYKLATRAIDPRRVRTGENASQWFNNFAVHTAGIYQRVEDLGAGRVLHLSAWVHCWTSSNDDSATSDGRYRMRIGLDPYGGVNPESPDIIWSDDGHAIQPYAEYQELKLETPARSDRVTVFTWGQNEWPMKHNNAYVDDVELSYLTEIPPPLPPPTGDYVTRQEFDELAAKVELLREKLWAGHLGMGELFEE